MKLTILLLLGISLVASNEIDELKALVYTLKSEVEELKIRNDQLENVSYIKYSLCTSNTTHNFRNLKPKWFSQLIATMILAVKI